MWNGRGQIDEKGLLPVALFDELNSRIGVRLGVEWIAVRAGLDGGIERRVGKRARVTRLAVVKREVARPLE